MCRTLYSTKCPTLVCQVSLLLGFVIGKSKNRYKDNANHQHFTVAQALLCYFRNAIVVPLPAKARTPGRLPIGHSQG